MPAPMHAHARACRSSSAPAGPLPLHAHARATPCRSRPPLPSRSPQPPHHCAPRDTHPGRAPHSRWLRSPRLLPPASRRLQSWPSSTGRPLSLAYCVLLPAAMRCSTTGTLLRHALDTAVDKCGGGIVNGVREGGGGEGVERQEVWAVSPGCGGGVYARRSRSGRRGHNWKESQKNHNPEISFQKMLISMEG